MFRHTDRETMKFALIGTVLTSVLGIAGTAMPLVGIMIYPAALFFFITAKKNGFIFTLPFVTAAYVFVGFGTSFLTAIADVLGPVLAAAVMGELLRLNRAQGEILIKGIGVASLCEIATLVALKVVNKVSVLESLRETMETTLNQAMESGQMTIHSAALVRQTYEYLLQIIPGLIISFVIIGVVFIFFEGTALLHRRGEEMKDYFPFRELSFPRSLIFGFLLMFVLAYLVGWTGFMDRNVLLLNISIVMWTLVCIQGTAVLSFLLNRVHFPRFLFIVLAVMLVFSTVGTVVFFLVGIVDLIFNIRARFDRKEE